MGFPGGSDGQESPYDAGELVQFLGREDPWEKGHGNPLQCCCLENPTDRGAWRATVHGIAKGRTQLSLFPLCFIFMNWTRVIIGGLTATSNKVSSSASQAGRRERFCSRASWSLPGWAGSGWGVPPGIYGGGVAELHREPSP